MTEETLGAIDWWDEGILMTNLISIDRQFDTFFIKT